MLGTVLAQALTFAFSFALTRLYHPADFGLYSVFLGMAAAVAAASTGALDRVIVLERTDQAARRVASAIIILSGIVALAACVVGLGVGALQLSTGVLAGPLGALELGVLLPVFIVSYAAAQVFTYSNLRRDRVNTIAGFKVAQSVATGVVQVVMASVTAVPGLILGNLTGWFLLAAAGLRSHFRSSEAWRGLRLRAVKAVLHRHSRYPRYVMPNQLLDSLSNQIPIFLIGTLLSLSAAGNYGLAIMILSAPSMVVGQAVGQAFLQHIGRHQGSPAILRRAMIHVWVGMAFVGAAPFATIVAFGPTIFAFAFGSTWTDAGIVAQSIGLLLFVRFVSSPTSTMYLKLGMQREQWHFVLAHCISRPAVYLLLIFGASLQTVIVGHAILESVLILLYNITALRRISRADTEGARRAR